MHRLLLLFLAAGLGTAHAETVKHKVLAVDRGHMAIIDTDGKMVWEYKARGVHDLHLLPNGNILYHQGTRVIELTMDKKEVWSYDAKNSPGNEKRRVEVHAFQRLPNGDTMIAESGAGRIVEVNPQGKIVKEVPLKLNHPHPHRDTRLARKLENGNYLVAHEGDGAVREYARDGQVVWDYDVPMFGKKAKGGHGPDSFGNKVFSAIRLANGNTLIGTGNGHSVLEVNPEKEIVWSITQHELPDIQLAWVTTLSRLKNGNTVIGNCHAGPDHPQLVEVTADKKVVWTFKDFKVFGNSVPNSVLVDLAGQVIR